MAPAPVRSLLDVRRSYLEPAAAELPRGQQVLARLPDAERVEVVAARTPWLRVRYAF